ncbi:YqhA family protein [Pseudooceanicola sp.]|uniref:YqhA family protein n=1 Tax=Pseudooceanicola sp. TaxID=1914328 RepID=UPI0035C7421B
MNFNSIERRIVVGSRYLTVAAVFGSLAGAILMFGLGLFNIYLAFAGGLTIPDTDEQYGAQSVISVIEALDRFLIGIVLLYFAYGVYTLFLHPHRSREELALPDWLRVRQIGQLKQVVAEVIIVVLFVLFLRLALQAFHSSTLTLEYQQIATLLVLPISVVLLALSLRLVQLHPKPTAAEEEPGPTAAKPGADGGDGAKDDDPEKG